MKNCLLVSLLFCITLPLRSQSVRTTLFDDGWRFHLGAAQAAEKPSFPDADWRPVDLPHDWSIEDIAGTHSPFDSAAVSQVSGGFTRGGTSWYRKTFTLRKEDINKQVIIRFDGVYMNADVWINGHHLGNHPYGYTSFYYNLTNYLQWNADNVIAVEVKNEGQNSRWYSGSGIYRHVWLQTLAPVHVAQWGTFVTTPKITPASATVDIQTDIQNETGTATAVRLTTTIINPAGVKLASTSQTQTIGKNSFITFTQSLPVAHPKLWSCDTPTLYRMETEVRVNNEVTDRYTTRFGIRTLQYSVNNGFQLNGRTIKLKGGCYHHDNGALGAKAYDRAEERKIELLKESGFNAIRCSHNPPSPAFLDACDSLGMLVMDETFDMWNRGKNPYDYHLYFKDWWQRDVQSMMLRDRNHPSIIMWSIGNEIPERADSLGVQTAAMMAAYIRQLDSSRPVTAAVNDLTNDKDPFFAQLGVSGYNYAIGDNSLAESRYDTDHRRVPGRIMVSTESYPLTAFGSWMAVENHSYLIGDFVWTAWDYLGEASIGWLGYPQSQLFYPWNLAFCGDIDVCGWKRPQSHYRDALWMKDQLSLFVKPPRPSYETNPNLMEWSKWNWLDVVPEWNWQGSEGVPLEVSVYSSCERAELLLNGRSLGVKETGISTQYTATWQVPYAAGKLTAIGYRGKTNVQSTSLHTPGAVSEIVLTADRKELKANNQDLAYITVELKDKNGNLHTDAVNEISFEIEGNASLAGVGNANPKSLESYQQPKRKAWKGKCLLIVKSANTAGTIVVKAKADGLPAATVTLLSK